MKKARNELLKSQELIHSVFNTTDIGIAVIDETGRYIKTNDGYNKMLGYESGELDGRLYTCTVPPGQKKEVHDKFNNLFVNGKGEEESQVLKKNGETIFVYWTAKLIYSSEAGKFLMVTIRDITESRKYRNLFLNTERIARIAGWEYDVLSKQITRTDEMYDILGITSSVLNRLTVEKKMENIYDPVSRPLIRKAWNEALRQGKPFDLQLAMNKGKNGKKWIRVTGTPEFMHSKICKIVGTLHDISNQKETELELERLSLVASKTNNAVFISDGLGKTIWINESVEKITGYSGAELMGKKPGDILQGPGTDPVVVTRMSKRLKKHLPVSEVIKNYKKDGTDFWMNMDIAPVFKNNKLENFIGVGIDVTELIHAREAEKIKDALEHRQKLFNSIARNFPDGIIGVLDKRLHYVFVGGAEIKKLGQTPEKFIGQNIFDHLSQSSNSEAVPFLKKALDGESVMFEAEMNGQIYSISAVPLPGSDKKETQLLVVLYNITQRKKAEEHVREALAQQMELNELKSKFVSIASHEFRTPLSTILSSTFLISKYSQSQDQEKAQKHIDRIETSVRTLTDILNDFLSLGRIEDGKVENMVSEFNVVEFCDTLTDEVQPTLKKGQSIIYHHEGMNHVFSLDRQHLRNVLVNLLSNASKYSPEGKTIWLTSAYANRQMQFFIKDEGIGIPVSDQPRLFQTFFRANNAVNIQGTGMGLHIVKRFLDIMGGRIQFTSEENKGSTFSIQFPSANQ